MNVVQHTDKQKLAEWFQSVCFYCCVLALTSCGESTLPVEQNQAPDPVLVDVPIAFIKRDLAIGEAGATAGVRDMRDPAEFLPGAALYIKARASASAQEINVTDRLFVSESSQDNSEEQVPAYDVKGLTVSYDGARLLFALREPSSEILPNPTWNIWEYHRQDDELRRVIASDIVAGSGEDTGPVYLPDGRILFSSTRQRYNQAILLDEGKPQYSGLVESLNTHASVLHVMNPDGTGIEQISFNQSHDLDPIVAPNGKVIFSRWDHAGGDKGIHLYQMNSDGSDLEILYGRHSHQQQGQTLHFTQSQITPSEQLLAAITEYRAPRLGGDYTVIDTQGFTDIDTPVASNPSASGQPQQPGLFADVTPNADYSLPGLFASLYPLWDGTGRYIYTWSQCRALAPIPEDASEDEERLTVPCNQEVIDDPNYSPAPPLFGLWLYDPADNTQLPLTIPQEGIAYTEAVALDARSFPADPSFPERDENLQNLNMGLVHIRSVYDFAGEDTSPTGINNISNPVDVAVDARSERFIRVVKSVSIPDDDVLDFNNSAFGRSRNQLFREVLGYAPIQPDGSSLFAVPANVPFAISIVDANGKRVSPRHQNWLQVVPGEIKTCNGCHTSQSTAPHGRLEAEAASINLGAPTNGGQFPGTNPAMFTDIGETMAETFVRIVGPSLISPNIAFTDVWSNPQTTTLAADINLTFADMATPLPITQACAQNWTALCRIEINYPEHIQPLFERVRETRNEFGEVIAERTCISCHSAAGADGLSQVPAAQLDLSGTPSPNNADVLTSYRELMFGDNAVELVDGVLVDIIELVVDENGDPVFLVDENGDLILDPEGNPIQVTRTVPVAPSMNVGGAMASSRFFTPLNDISGSHSGFLDPVEQKLIAEWLDIGGQYYNNPFAIPPN